MPDTLSVRRYEPADADAVWRVHERALRASPVAFVEDAPADEPLRDVADHYLDGDGEFLVGTVEGDVVAVGGLRVREDGLAEVENLRVDPDHQGRGYGARVLAELEERARSAGARRIDLHTNADLTAARGLYETRGYEETGRGTHATSGFTFVHYRKRLPE